MKIRNGILMLGMLMSSLAVSAAQEDIVIGTSRVSIGINLPVYPQLARVPGYPVYYAPRLNANYFFYDGLYWVFHGDNWYASSWYNGPWSFVDSYAVPVYILRVPVRYYRQPPSYFRGWRADAPPHWQENWGRNWEQRRNGWDNWDRRAAPAAAPLPSYQRQYSRDQYPRQMERQRQLQQDRYRYQPRDPVVQQHNQERIQRQDQNRPRDQRDRGRDQDQRQDRGRNR